MAKQAAAAETKRGWIAQAREFLEDVKKEMKKVTWPTWAELKANTSIVLLVLAMVAMIIFFYDKVFGFVVVGLFKVL